MILCPGAGMGAWLPLCMLCLAAILREPKRACPPAWRSSRRRAAAATGDGRNAAAAVYAFALCATALFMLLGVIPGVKTSEGKADDR